MVVVFRIKTLRGQNYIVRRPGASSGDATYTGIPVVRLRIQGKRSVLHSFIFPFSEGIPCLKGIGMVLGILTPPPPYIRGKKKSLTE